MLVTGILVQNFAVSIILIMFAIWNWFLLFKGMTVIEFMQRRSQSMEAHTFELPHWRENLYTTFGTTSPFKAMMPFGRPQVLSGLEWTFANFDRECKSLCSYEGDDRTQEEV